MMYFKTSNPLAAFLKSFIGKLNQWNFFPLLYLLYFTVERFNYAIIGTNWIFKTLRILKRDHIFFLVWYHTIVAAQ